MRDRLLAPFYVLLVNKPEFPPSAHSRGSERGELEQSGVFMVRATEKSHVSPALITLRLGHNDRFISAP